MNHKSGSRPLALPAALTLVITLCACAQPAPPTAKETPAMTSTVTEQPYRVHTLDEFPQFTPQEMGRRMLALIDSIHSSSQLTLEQIRKVTGVTMERLVPPSKDYGFTIHLPESNWYYGLVYSESEYMKTRTVSFDFRNTADGKGRPYVDYYADMTPVCLDYDAYVAALERMGFEKKRDFYNDRHWLEATYYEHGDVGVEVRTRVEKANETENANRGRTCLEYISVAVSSQG